MTEEDLSYLAPVKTVRVRFKVRGSRFVATLGPVTSEKGFKNLLNKVCTDFPDATHHVYVYRIGSGLRQVERFSDDKEPAGSAALPILQVLKGRNISDAGLIATRYYGGTKLGFGGLTRAYRDCARLCLEEAKLVTKLRRLTLQLSTGYEDLGPVNRLLESLEGEIEQIAYAGGVTILIRIPEKNMDRFLTGFSSVVRGRGSYKIL